MTTSMGDTRCFGAALADLVGVGDVIILVGDLGAGKTVFVQGFAAALGVTSPVTSPTFTLANRYQGKLIVNHLDVYRFEYFEEAHDLALVELFDDGVTLVEWGNRIISLLPPTHLLVEIRFQFDTGPYAISRSYTTSDSSTTRRRPSEHTGSLHSRPCTTSDSGATSDTDSVFSTHSNTASAAAGFADDIDNAARLIEVKGRGESWLSRSDRIQFALKRWT